MRFNESFSLNVILKELIEISYNSFFKTKYIAMPPINIKARHEHSYAGTQPFIPTVKQKREMHFYLKMLLHINGSLPNFAKLQSFWDLSASQKEMRLKEEMLGSKFDPDSTFGQLDFFYGKLIGSIKDKNPTVFKKGNLLNPWHSTLGKTFEEFRNNELKR